MPLYDAVHKFLKLQKNSIMNAWSNIQISPDDPEIHTINMLEKQLGNLPDNVNKIRELITRFEVCHFKYQQHLMKIKASIRDLEPKADPAGIGKNHIQHGEEVIKKDNTGRSRIAMQYIRALRNWSSDEPQQEITSGRDANLDKNINIWLGDRNNDKVRLVRLLIARLTWDWKSYEELQQGEAYKDLEFQLCRMDICHFAFPENLNEVLKGIGQMKALEESSFSGCGSYNERIKNDLEKEFLRLNDTLKEYKNRDRSDINDLCRYWLTACLAKTIKENIVITIPIT